jgi:hypothetical protein
MWAPYDSFLSTSGMSSRVCSLKEAFTEPHLAADPQTWQLLAFVSPKVIGFVSIIVIDCVLIVFVDLTVIVIGDNEL